MVQGLTLSQRENSITVLNNNSTSTKLVHPKKALSWKQTADAAAIIAVSIIAFLVCIFTCGCCCWDRPRYGSDGLLLTPSYSWYRPTTWRYAAPRFHNTYAATGGLNRGVSVFDRGTGRVPGGPVLVGGRQVPRT